MVNQAVSESSNNIQKSLKILLVLLTLGTFLVVGYFFLNQADPYTKQVLSLPGDRNKGEMIFKINCSACHGLQAGGVIGPSLLDVTKRKSKRGLIEQVTSGKTPPMPKFQASPQEMADLLSFLEYL
ncbi:MAG: cytochrome c [Cyanobacteriota bacterium ELA615]